MKSCLYLQNDANDEQVGFEISASAGSRQLGDVNAEEVVTKLDHIVDQIGGNAEKGDEGGHRGEDLPENQRKN
jgi:hypothetical protein